MHGIAGPHDMAALLFHRPDEQRQMAFHLVMAEAGDESEPSRLIGRVQDVDELQEFVGLETRPAFEAEGILYAPAVLDMGTVGMARAVADPQHMSRCGVPIT